MPLKSGGPGTPLSGGLEDVSLTAAKSCNCLACLAVLSAEWWFGTASTMPLKHAGIVRCWCGPGVHPSG